MCSPIDWKNTSYFFFFFCFFMFYELPMVHWNIKGTSRGPRGWSAGESIVQHSCPRNNKAPWHNYKNVCCRFPKIAPAWAHQHKHTQNTHTHMLTYTHLYICVWPGTCAYLLLLLGRLINWLLKVLKIENKILRYQNKIPARVRGRGGSANPAPPPASVPCHSAW